MSAAPRAPGRRRLAAAVVLAALAASGCVERGTHRVAERAEERWARDVRRHGVDPASIPNPLRSTEAMRETAARLAGVGGSLDRLRSLQDAMFDEQAFPYDYASRRTLTAVEAFEARTGNCVSFTNLFIAMARSLGLPVRAALLTESPDVETQGGLVVVNNHIVAVYEVGDATHVFDFNRTGRRRAVGMRVIGDAWITAIYLNNRGAEELLAGRPGVAAGYVETAVALAPDFAPAYGNLGLLRRRLGDVDGAFEAYRRALEIDPSNATVLTNLAVLHRSQGREAEARAALRAADLRGATPYLLVIRGDFDMLDGNHRRALRLYRRASRLAPTSPGPWLGVARAEIALGRPDRAREALRRVVSIDPDDELAAAMLRGLPPG